MLLPRALAAAKSQMVPPTFEDTVHISMAQGQIGGYSYYLVIQRKASIG